MACLSVSREFLCVSSIEDTLVVPLEGEGKYTVLNHSDEKSEIKNDEPPCSPEEHYDGSVPTVSGVFSTCGKLFACCSQKSLSVWDAANWTIICKKTIPRACSKIIFTPLGDAVVIADKSGDVHLYYLDDKKEPSPVLLGHVSMLLDMLISSDGKHIITCDRDEKIRVSSFPDSYDIVSYCLGHEDYVTSINLLPNDNKTLLSSGGDGTFRLWNYVLGKELLSYEVKDNVSLVRDSCDIPLIHNVALLSQDEDTTIVCSLIYKTDAVWVHSIKCSEKFLFEFIHFVTTQSEPYCLALLNPTNTLWVLQLDNQQCIEALAFESNKLINRSDNCVRHVKEIVLNHMKDKIVKNLLEKKVASLYKKKYDNESEYNKRKLERLEAEKNKRLAKCQVPIGGK